MILKLFRRAVSGRPADADRTAGDNIAPQQRRASIGPVEYLVAGGLPVKLVPVAAGGWAMLKMSGQTGVFEFANEYYTGTSLTGHPGINHVSEDDFIQYVESLRSRRVAGDSPLTAMYQLINGIEDVAASQRRELVPEEQALRYALRQQTYAFFQTHYPDDEVPDS